MSDAPSSAPVDTTLRRLREYVAAGIALLVVLGTFGMLIASFAYIENDEAFARVKDLLLIVNPILGVVIGYYFNKTSTEARAESAESTARTATASAQQAATARDAAEVKVQTAMSTLSDLQGAAEKMLAQSAPASAVLGAEEQPSDDARVELRVALERAKRVTGQGAT